MLRTTPVFAVAALRVSINYRWRAAMAVIIAAQTRPRRTIVFGGRDFIDKDWLFRVLDGQHAAEPFACIIEGGQVSVDPAENGRPWEKRRKWGADYFARQWANSRGVSVHTVKADWRTFGKAAGPKRNQRMIDEYSPTEGIAFPGGRGTADMLTRIKAAKLDWMTVSRTRDSGSHSESRDRKGSGRRLAERPPKRGIAQTLPVFTPKRQRWGNE
jgi:hypothetical protein